jgi:hypothetical protein
MMAIASSSLRRATKCLHVMAFFPDLPESIPCFWTSEFDEVNGAIPPFTSSL